MTEGNKTEMTVDSLAIDSVSKVPVVILKDATGNKSLHIWIGPSEAHAIAMELEDIRPPRPMTHDLMKTLLGTLGGTAESVQIHDLKNDTFYAYIEVITATGERIMVDSRPSDAIALILRVGGKIYVSDDVIKNAKPAEVIEEASIDNEDEVKKWLRDLKPEDFGSMEQ